MMNFEMEVSYVRLNTLKSKFPLTWRNTGIFALVFSVATAVCFLMQPVSDNDMYALPIFILAVTIISLKTGGYLYGICGSVLAVIFVNYIFTYPYMAFNFTITGYPLTFIVMLAVSLIISTLTSGIKKQERIRMENEKEAIRANLLRAISHDLRTPLTSIVGATSTILDNYDSLTSETKRELLGEVREDAQWLIRMVENILSITRIGTDPSQANLAKKPEAVEEILSEVLEKFKKQYPGTEVSVKVPETLLIVPMDAMLIEQVIVNIMENAVIHGVTTTEISITAYRRNMEAVFEIRNNGKSISPDVLPWLTKENRPGPHEPQKAEHKRNMGIGLSVCTSIVKAHGGVLSVKNLTDSGGSEFCFTLPMTE
jgi:two-component system sensor histidine kinase KdpD